jgi:hypothetical protein
MIRKRGIRISWPEMIIDEERRRCRMIRPGKRSRAIAKAAIAPKLMFIRTMATVTITLFLKVIEKFACFQAPGNTERSKRLGKEKDFWNISVVVRKELRIIHMKG